jgi:hypothetical protein
MSRPRRRREIPKARMPPASLRTGDRYHLRLLAATHSCDAGMHFEAKNMREGPSIENCSNLLGPVEFASSD